MINAIYIIGHFGKYHNTLSILPSSILTKKWHTDVDTNKLTTS